MSARTDGNPQWVVYGRRAELGDEVADGRDCVNANEHEEPRLRQRLL